MNMEHPSLAPIIIHMTGVYDGHTPCADSLLRLRHMRDPTWLEQELRKPMHDQPIHRSF